MCLYCKTTAVSSPCEGNHPVYPPGWTLSSILYYYTVMLLSTCISRELSTIFVIYSHIVLIMYYHFHLLHIKKGIYSHVFELFLATTSVLLQTSPAAAVLRAAALLVWSALRYDGLRSKRVKRNFLHGFDFLLLTEQCSNETTEYYQSAP